MRYLKKYKIFESKDDILETLVGIFEDLTDEDDLWKVMCEKISETSYRVVISPIVNWDIETDYDHQVYFKNTGIIERAINYMNDFEYQICICSDGEHVDGEISKIDLRDITTYGLFARGTEETDYFEISFRKKNINNSNALLNITNNVDKSLISIITKDFPVKSKILEISCGNGSDALYLKKLGYDVTCTESNIDYVNNAKSLGLNCIQHHTENKFPFKNDEFDLIYCRLGLHYFDRTELYFIFNELYRMTKSKLLITVKIEEDLENTGKIIFNENSWRYIIQNFFKIKSLNKKEGLLYNKQSTWIEIYAEPWKI